MTTITKDYKILVMAPDGIIFETIDLLDYDLDKSIARGIVMNEVKEAIAIYEQAENV